MHQRTRENRNEIQRVSPAMEGYTYQEIQIRRKKHRHSQHDKIETNVKNPKSIQWQTHQNVYGSEIMNSKKNGAKTGRSMRSSGQFIGVKGLGDGVERKWKWYPTL